MRLLGGTLLGRGPKSHPPPAPQVPASVGLLGNETGVERMRVGTVSI